MKKIAILACLKSNRVCTGAACLKAYNERIRSFSRYESQPLELMAFSFCNGCHEPLADSPGLQEKVERLISIGTEVVHLGICTQLKQQGECPIITEVAEQLVAAGIQVIRGTH